MTPSDEDRLVIGGAMAMRWHMSHRFDKRALPLADRHYNRRKIGSPQFVPPGRCLVMLTDPVDALWVTSHPFAEYVRHAWPGAWVCSCFRNEGTSLSSELIREALAATRAKWPEVPALGMITFIDRKKVRPIMVRGKKTWGRTYALAGFRHVGETKGGLMAMQILAEDMPAASPAHHPPADAKPDANQLRLGWAT